MSAAFSIRRLCAGPCNEGVNADQQEMSKDEPEINGKRVSREAENQNRQGIPDRKSGREGDDLIPDGQTTEAGENCFFLRSQCVQNLHRLRAGLGMAFGEDPNDDQTEKEREEAEHEEDAVVCDRLNDHGPVHTVEADTLGDEIINSVDSKHRDGDRIAHENGLNFPEPRTPLTQDRRKERHEPPVRRAAVIEVPASLREACVSRFHAGVRGVYIANPPHHDPKCDEDSKPTQSRRQKQRKQVDVKNGILRRRLGNTDPPRAGEQQICNPRAEEKPDDQGDEVKNDAFREK